MRNSVIVNHCDISIISIYFAALLQEKQILSYLYLCYISELKAVFIPAIFFTLHCLVPVIGKLLSLNSEEFDAWILMTFMRIFYVLKCKWPTIVVEKVAVAGKCVQLLKNDLVAWKLIHYEKGMAHVIFMLPSVPFMVMLLFTPTNKGIACNSRNPCNCNNSVTLMISKKIFFSMKTPLHPVYTITKRWNVTKLNLCYKA